MTEHASDHRRKPSEMALRSLIACTSSRGRAGLRISAVVLRTPASTRIYHSPVRWPAPEVPYCGACRRAGIGRSLALTACRGRRLSNGACVQDRCERLICGGYCSSSHNSLMVLVGGERLRTLRTDTVCPFPRAAAHACASSNTLGEYTCCPHSGNNAMGWFDNAECPRLIVDLAYRRSRDDVRMLTVSSGPAARLKN